MKRVCSWFVVIMGVLGMALCGVSLVGIWNYYPQWNHKTQELYSKIDEALVEAGERIDLTHARVATVNAMTADFRTSLKEWATAKQFDHDHVGHRAELIAVRLHHAQEGLEFADSFLQKVRSAQRLSHPFRKETETQQLDGLLEELGKLQVHVSSLVDSVDEIRQRAEESGDEAELEQTIEQAIDEIVHVMEIIDTADDRLDKLSGHVTDARAKAARLEVQVVGGLWWGRLGASIILPWMALGQLALCVLAQRRGSNPRQAEESGLPRA